MRPVRFLGGSTGATLYDTEQGPRVGKQGAHPAHIQNEFDMNRYLNALGVNVPQAEMITHGGRPTMLADFIADSQEVGTRPTQEDVRQLQRDFVPHALTANWDVLGMTGDNVLRQPDGSLSYVDVGGAGAFRAMGAPKGDRFTTNVGELDSLRERNPVFQGMSEQDIGRSLDAHGGIEPMEQALQYLRDAQTRNIMQQRVQDLARRVA